jgi:phosphoribosylamine--glycine ligase
MNILFVSNDLIAGNLAYLMTQEGHSVKIFIQDKDRRKNFGNLVEKTTNWRKELTWVGKNGLIVFDDVGFGKDQKELRKAGYAVAGGSELGDKLENDRQYADKIFSDYGIKTMPLKDFSGIDQAITFLKKNKGPWVIKQNGHASKSFNCVGLFPDNCDTINVLENYKKNNKKDLPVVTLQKKIIGVEIGVGRYFNGHDWTGPIELNIEYKRFFPGDLGPNTGEMGTVAWYDNNEKNKLFQETIAKLKPYLQKIDFRGDFEINFIINKDGAWPLEPTPRFGSPIVHLQSELNNSPWAKFLNAVARGQNYKMNWKRGYGLVLLLAVPPLPYAVKIPGVSSEGINIIFDKEVKNKMEHIHFEEVSSQNKKSSDSQLYISDSRGFVIYVTEVGKTIEEVREKVYGIAQHIHVPKMFYRQDIGLSFANDGINQLKKFGYSSILPRL